MYTYMTLSVLMTKLNSTSNNRQTTCAHLAVDVMPKLLNQALLLHPQSLMSLWVLVQSYGQADETVGGCVGARKLQKHDFSRKFLCCLPACMHLSSIVLRNEVPNGVLSPLYIHYGTGDIH